MSQKLNASMRWQQESVIFKTISFNYIIYEMINADDQLYKLQNKMPRCLPNVNHTNYSLCK